MTILIGYARVSKADQNLDLQKDALTKAGCRRIFNDHASGAKIDRVGFKEAIEFCNAGDTLVVWKLDRLSRSIRQLIETMLLLKEKNIGLKSLQENIDTTSTGGKLIFHIFSSIAEFERDIIRDRTRAGLSSARARGRVGGRPKGMDEKKIALAKKLRQDHSLSIDDICKTLGVKRTTYYKYTKEEKTTDTTEA